MIWIIDTISYVFLEVFFFFSQIRKEPTNKHAKENLLNFEEDLVLLRLLN